MKLKDLRGQRFSKWTVLEYATKRSWLCRCVCGNERVVNTGNLATGKSTQCRECGPLCGGGTNRLPDGAAIFNDLCGRYRSSAKQRGIEWKLSPAEIDLLFKKDCFYCGCAPSQIWERKKLGLRGEVIYNGIDRLDSSQGYTFANCVSCCKACNYMKRSMSVEAFRKHIFAVAEHFTLREIERECFAKAEAL